jgi:hypothetical protein
MATWHEDLSRVSPATRPRRSSSSEQLRNLYRERDREPFHAPLKDDARDESGPNVRTEHKNISSGRRIPEEWSLEDQIADLQMELRAQARSRSRPGGWHDHHLYGHSLPREAQDYEDRIQLTIAQQKLREAEEKLERLDREDEMERREDLLKRKLELKYVKDRAEREAEEQRIKEQEQRLRREWELEREKEERERDNRLREKKIGRRTGPRNAEANGGSQSLDGESSDEAPENKHRVHHVNIYNTITTKNDRYDHNPSAERHSRRANTFEEEARHIEQPPDDIVNTLFDRLMLRKGWYELPDDAQDEMMIYPPSKKWDIISQDRNKGVERRNSSRDSRSVRFGEVPQIIDSYVGGTSSRAPGPLPRGTRGDTVRGDIERETYVCSRNRCCTTTHQIC